MRTRLPFAALAPLAVSMLLSACAINRDIGVSTVGSALAAGTRLAIAMPDNDAELETQFANAFTTELSGRGFLIEQQGAIEQDSAYLVQFGIAVRDASIALVRADKDSNIVVISPARPDYILDRCDAQHLRLQVAAIDQQSGAIVRKATLAMLGCKFTQDDVLKLAEAAADQFAGV